MCAYRSSFRYVTSSSLNLLLLLLLLVGSIESNLHISHRNHSYTDTSRLAFFAPLLLVSCRSSYPPPGHIELFHSGSPC